MTRLLRVAAVVVLVGGSAAVLSSCSDSSAEVVSPSPAVTSAPPEPSPSVTPTPTALPPLTDEDVLALIPADAQVESFPSSVNFAKFFMQEYASMFWDGDSRLFAAVSLEDCDFCARTLQDFDQVNGQGGSVTGGAITFPNDEFVGGLQSTGRWHVSFDIYVDPVTYFDASGGVISEVPEFVGRAAVEMLFVDGRWAVWGVGAEEASSESS